MRTSPINNLLLLISTFFIIITLSDSQTIQLPSDKFKQTDICPIPETPPSQSSCPINCFRPDPVCGVDGVTYWCGCADAHCAGVQVAKLGFCEIGNNGGNLPLPGQALLLVHIVWLIVLGLSVSFGLF